MASKNPSLLDDMSKEEKTAMKANMAKLQAQPMPKRDDKVRQFQLKGYVHCDLAKADRASFEAWENSALPGDLFDAIAKLADSGYIFKVAEGKEGYQSALSAVTVHDEVNGYVLTAFASSADRAIKLLLFKHLVLMESDWAPFIGTAESDFLR